MIYDDLVDFDGSSVEYSGLRLIKLGDRIVNNEYDCTKKNNINGHVSW